MTIETAEEWRVPAEWEPRDGTLLAWPPAHPWVGADPDLLATYRALIRLLRGHEPVRLLVPPDERDHLARELGGEDASLRLEPYLVNDVWMRDAGPLCARPSGPGRGREAVFLDGGFDGWGQRHPYEMDRLIPTVLSRRWGVPRVRLPITVEGGAVEVNGQGDLLCTEAVLLGPARGNPGREAVEQALGRYFGAERVHWLERGLGGDDTGGHVDNLARFVAPSRLVCSSAGVPSAHPDAEVLRAVRRGLEELSTVGGRPEIVELPVPEVHDRRGRRLAASYTNFYLAPDLVLVPLCDPDADERALGVLREVFPARRVEGLDARPLLAQGGAFHCITQPLLLTRGAP
jgi:agmatine deiminase